MGVIMYNFYGESWQTRAYNRRLSDDDVRDIRASKLTNKELAHKYKVVSSTISSIRLFKHRRNVK